jgi:hypothetical protein
MKRVLLAGVALGAMGLFNGAEAADASLPAKVPVGCRTVVDPYKNYACLDAYLGNDFFTRLFNYYRLEWGHIAAPSDPKAPPSRRPESEVPPTPQTTPPMPFTEWPYGGTTSLGVTRPSSVDSPLMAALGNTGVGSWMNDNHIQVYGWVDPGGNLSTNTVKGGNAPAAYSYNPNTVQLDQAVVYIERLPDTVQKDHIDWGFRIAPIYGENYRYTTAYGLFSSQLLNQNLNNGFDIPMAYGEMFIPQVMDGLLIRFGRYISIPDIEAQLAPNNYMYSHSMTYTFDNYTNTGLEATLAATKNWIFQAGLVVGTESLPWHVGQTIDESVPEPAVSRHHHAEGSGRAAERHPWHCATPATAATTTSISSRTASMAAPGATTTCNGTALRTITSSTTSGTSRSKPTTSTRTTCPTAQPATAVAAIANGGTPFSPQYMPFNAPGARHLQHSRCDQLYRVFPDGSDVSELQGGSRWTTSRTAWNSSTICRAAHRHQDALRRDRYRLAALVLAPDRDPARGFLLQVAGCERLQRQLEPRHRA